MGTLMPLRVLELMRAGRVSGRVTEVQISGD